MLTHRLRLTSIRIRSRASVMFRTFIAPALWACSTTSPTAEDTADTGEPPAGILLFAENFDDNALASRGWYDNTTVLVNTSEHVTGSTGSAQYRYLAGEQEPTHGGGQRHKFTPTTAVYV